ncbi:MAG: Shedu immune nuclease family protein [Nitrospira sp.]
MISLQPGQPIQFSEVEEVPASDVVALSVSNTIGRTLRAYGDASRQLMEGKYANQKDLAPPHIREACDVFVIRCSDGVLVRYDHAGETPTKVRCTQSEQSLSEVAPLFSEQVIHFPPNPETYVPAAGPELVLGKMDASGVMTDEFLKIRPLVYASAKLPENFKMPAPPVRPPCLAAIRNDFTLDLHGELLPADTLTGTPSDDPDQFIAHARFALNVGWQTIEIYPPLPDKYWRPEYAPIWAELDLLAALAQANTVSSKLNAIDSRAATRQRYADLLEEFERLLAGPEEPVHQFLKSHPELLCPTMEQSWSKLPFGDRISDFVFREPHNDYELVELEAPMRELFRKDGQQREELTHAINQILDWLQYIANNKKKVESELGLQGISTNPRTLIFIGRSASLTEQNRRKLSTIQASQNKLRILTYDDLLAGARSNLERILGPMALRSQNAQLYFFKRSALPEQK